MTEILVVEEPFVAEAPSWDVAEILAGDGGPGDTGIVLPEDEEGAARHKGGSGCTARDGPPTGLSFLLLGLVFLARLQRTT